MVDKYGFVLNPESFVSDFEAGVRKVIREEIPNCKQLGCNFHFTQSIIRFVQQNGMVTTYRSNIVFRTGVRMLMALAFLPLHY